MSGLSDAAQFLSVPGSDQALVFLAFRRRVLGFSERVQRALVLVAMVAVKTHAKLAEGVFEERALKHDAGQPSVARWLQVNLIECSCEVVGLLSRAGFAES